MKAVEFFREKLFLMHKDGKRVAILQIVFWEVPKNKNFPEGCKYRAWLSEEGRTIVGFDNHAPKGHHMHMGEIELEYHFQGFDQLLEDIQKFVLKEGFIYED